MKPIMELQWMDYDRTKKCQKQPIFWKNIEKIEYAIKRCVSCHSVSESCPHFPSPLWTFKMQLVENNVFLKWFSLLIIFEKSTDRHWRAERS